MGHLLSQLTVWIPYDGYFRGLTSVGSTLNLWHKLYVLEDADGGKSVEQGME